MLIINFFGTPGSGKSTGAAYIFSKLKMKGINAELVTEFAKDKVWEESKEVFKNQFYIFGKQYFRISRCKDKVDVIITDSPLLLSSFYNQDPLLDINFSTMVLNIFNSFNNMNFFINRVKPYNPKGRLHNEKESDSMKSNMLNFLDDNNIYYNTYDGCKEDYDKIVNQIMKIIN